MADIAASSAHAARMVGSETLDAVIEYFVPIGASVAGFAVAPQVLGGQVIVDKIYSAMQSTNSAASSTTANRVGFGILAVVLGAIGGAFWRLGHRGGWIMKLLGKGIGGFFLGGAVGYALYGPLLGQQPPGTASRNGLFDMVTGGITNISEGN